MRFSLLSRKKLSDIPSASGIEVIGDSMYIMGDDSPWLFRLDEKFEVTEKIAIGDINAAVNGKIPKPVKPDLEAMAAFGNELLLFGSGSKSPQRDILVQVNTKAGNSVKKYSLVQFYNSLCTISGFTRKELNIEAAVIVEEALYLFNRGKNIIFKLNPNELLIHTEGKRESPAFEIFRVKLPSLNEIESGFSGACATPDQKQIVFTASVENTPNWIDDGDVLGSFVGIFPIISLKNYFSPGCVAVTDKENNILKIKVESVAVHRVSSSNKLQLLLVTDSDGSASELIKGELEL
jgi:hypothetical protein